MAEREACSTPGDSVEFATRRVAATTQIFRELLGFTDYAKRAERQDGAVISCHREQTDAISSGTGAGSAGWPPPVAFALQ